VNATTRAAALSALEAIVGARNVLTDPAMIAGALVEPRGLYQGKALALVRPASTEEVSAVVAFCNAARIGLVPQGGNTGLVGGQTPDESGSQVILSTQRLKAIREVDAHANVMICEAGVTLAEAQAGALAADRLFPLSLASEGTCTIGGNLSTNAGGVTVVAYGAMRDLVTGVEAVLADGRVIHGLSKLRKDNTGYDLRGLFVGAEGTLGIVTAASLRLFPNPRARATAFVGLASPERALDLLALARERLGAGVTSFELMARLAYDMPIAHGFARAPLRGAHDWCVLIEASSQIAAGFDEAFADMLGTSFEREIIEDAAIAASLEQRHAFWNLRESIPEAQKREGGSIKHDVSVAVGDTPRFIAEATPAVEAFSPGCRVVCFGHLGDGNMHFNVSQPIGAETAAYLAGWEAMNEVVHAIVARFGGSFSAEHGIGRLKRDLLARSKDPASLAAMRAIKTALDPNGVMNPGKVV
jgi:FAD/FMN-containing dehydrogenase